jgi:hypothetical protein
MAVRRTCSYGFCLISWIQLLRIQWKQMLRLDYISCLLTIVSTILVGRRLWQGWIVAGINSVIICLIGLRTSQTGFVPANLFCLGIYGYNLVQWRSHGGEAVGSGASDT